MLTLQTLMSPTSTFQTFLAHPMILTPTCPQAENNEHSLMAKMICTVVAYRYNVNPIE